MTINRDNSTSAVSNVDVLDWVVVRVLKDLIKVNLAAAIPRFLNVFLDGLFVTHSRTMRIISIMILINSFLINILSTVVLTGTVVRNDWGIHCCRFVRRTRSKSYPTNNEVHSTVYEAVHKALLSCTPKLWRYNNDVLNEVPLMRQTLAAKIMTSVNGVHQ